jgi:hypothetical protein
MIVGGVSVNILHWFENRASESPNDLKKELAKLISVMIR